MCSDVRVAVLGDLVPGDSCTKDIVIHDEKCLITPRLGRRTAVCVSPICQHGLLFIGVYVPSRHQLLFLPYKCQILTAILPVPL